MLKFFNLDGKALCKLVCAYVSKLPFIALAFCYTLATLALLTYLWMYHTVFSSGNCMHSSPSLNFISLHQPFEVAFSFKTKILYVNVFEL